MFNQRKNSLLALVLLTTLAAPPLTFSLRTSDALFAQETSAEALAFPRLDTVNDGMTVNIASSPSMRVINQRLKVGFEAEYPETSVKISEINADAALKAVLEGSVDLAAIGRPVTPEEAAQGLVGVEISREKIAIIVGPDNPFSQASYRNNLTAEEFARIFRGEINNWLEVGGPNTPIRFIDRPENSDIRQTLSQYEVFRAAEFATGANAVQMAEDDTAAIVRQLGRDGVSYAIASQVTGQDNVRIVAMHATLATDERYPFSQPRGYVYRQGEEGPSNAVRVFLGFATDISGEEAVEAAKTFEAATVATADIPPGIVAVSPKDAILASSGRDGYLQLRNFQGDLIDPTKEPIKAHIGPITAIAFSPDGQTIATSGADGVVKLWDLQDQLRDELLADHEDPITAVAFNPKDGQTLVSGGQDGALRFWDLQRQEQSGEPILAHTGGIRAIAFSPDGKLIATGGADQMLRLWNLNGESMGQPLTGHSGAVTAIAFSPDQPSSPEPQSELDQPSSADQPGSPEQIPPGLKIVSGSEDQTLRLWDISAISANSEAIGQLIGTPFKGHQGAIAAVAFSPDGQTIISGSENEPLHRWNLNGEAIDGAFPDESAAATNSTAFGPDGQTMVSITADGVPKFWHLSDGEPIDQLPPAPVPQMGERFNTWLKLLNDLPPWLWSWIVGGAATALLGFIVWWLFGDREWKEQKLEEVEPSQRSIDVSPTSEEVTDAESSLPASETPALPSSDFEEADFATVSSEDFATVSSEDFATVSSEDFATVSSEDFATVSSEDFATVSSEDFATVSSEDFATVSSEDVAEDLIPSPPSVKEAAPATAPTPISKLAQAKTALVEGIKLARSGRYDKALDRLQIAIEAADVERFKALSSGASLASATALLASGMARRGNILVKLGRIDEAMVSLNKAVELKPNSITILVRKAKALKDMGQAQEAQTFLKQAAKLKRKNTRDPVRLTEESILGKRAKLTARAGADGSASLAAKAKDSFPQPKPAKPAPLGDKRDKRIVAPKESSAALASPPPELPDLPHAKAIASVPSNGDSEDIPEDVRAALAAIPTEISALDEANLIEVNQPEAKSTHILENIPPSEESRVPADWPDIPQAKKLEGFPSDSDLADIPAEVRAALKGIPPNSADSFG